MVNPRALENTFLGHVLQGREVWLNEGNLSLGRKDAIFVFRLL